MILSLLAMMAVQQTNQSVVPLGTYEINPVVAPYFRRYVDCIEGHVRDHVAQPASTAALRGAYDEAVAACGEVRRTEYAQAERALQRSRTIADAGERHRAVDDAFRSGDRTRNQYGEALRREMREQQSVEARLDPSAIAAAKQETDPPAASMDVPMGRLDIPDEVGPAIVPYVQCLMASNGVQMRSTAGAPQPPAAAVGANCSAIRQQAAHRAEEMLRAQGRRDPAERRAFVERALVSADNFAASAARPSPAPEEKPNADD